MTPRTKYKRMLAVVNGIKGCVLLLSCRKRVMLTDAWAACVCLLYVSSERPITSYERLVTKQSITIKQDARFIVENASKL